MNNFWSHWYFHIPNFVLAAVMYTLIGRLVLGFFVPQDWDNYIWRGFKAVTEPFVRIVRSISPEVVAQPVVLVFGVLWIMVIRISFLLTLVQLGLAPFPQGS